MIYVVLWCAYVMYLYKNIMTACSRVIRMGHNTIITYYVGSNNLIGYRQSQKANFYGNVVRSIN